MGKAKIISMINYKGGVGKTTSAFNVAAGLSFLNHHSVLLIDLDPQCSLSYICLKAYQKTKQQSLELTLADLLEEETINHVFRTYLHEDLLDYDIQIDLNKLIKKDFYTGRNHRLKNFDFISAGRCQIGGNIGRGLDDLEIDIIKKFASNPDSQIKTVTILAKFINDHKLQDKYDFIIIDCPPSNNLMTQNALLVSDYYMIPTIMDNLSTEGISQLKYVVEKTYLSDIKRTYSTAIALSPSSSYLSFLKHKETQMLGIFETMRKGKTDEDKFRQYINEQYPKELFNPIIKHHKALSTETGIGISCFESLDLTSNSSKQMYGQLVNEMLERLNVRRHYQARSLTSHL